jgi:hypothetical protein
VSVLIHKEHLTTSEALRFSKKMGKNISATALYHHGLKLGFMVKHSDGYHWSFDRKKLSVFLMQKVVTPPPGWVTIDSLASKYRTNLSWVYVRIKKWGLEVMRCGPKRKIHVNERHYLVAVKKFKEGV